METLGIDNEYLRVSELTRKANLMCQRATGSDVEFKPILRVPKVYLTKTTEPKDYSETEEEIVGVLQRRLSSESEIVMTTSDFQLKLLALERMNKRCDNGDSTDHVERDVEDSFVDPFYSIEHHTLVGVASIPLKCIQTSQAVEFELPVISPSGLMSGKLAVNLQVLFVDNESQQNSDDTDTTIGVGSNVGLKVDILHVKNLPSIYGNFLFGQYDMLGCSDQTVFYSEEQSTIPLESDPEISLDFNHCQVYTVEVTEEVLHHINSGSIVVELWGHNGATITDGTAMCDSEDLEERCVNNCVQLWVQILEETDGDYQPVLVEEEPVVDTGGLFVLTKGKKKQLSVQVIPQSKGIHCLSVPSVAISSLAKISTTPQQSDVKSLKNMIGSWTPLESIVEQGESVFDRKKSFAKKRPPMHLESLEEEEEDETTDMELKQKLVEHLQVQFPTGRRGSMPISGITVCDQKSKSVTPGDAQTDILKQGVEKKPPIRRKSHPSKLPHISEETSYTKSDSVEKAKEKASAVGFMERRTSYPYGSHDKQEIQLKMLRSAKPNEAVAEWDSNFDDIEASCAAVWYCEVVVTAELRTNCTEMLVFKKDLSLKVLNPKHVDNYTSFITGFGGKTIGTRSGALFELSSEKQRLLRSNSTSYIELYQDEKPVAKFQERLRYVHQLRKKRSIKSSITDLMPIESESDDSDEEVDEPSSHSPKVVRQTSINYLDVQIEPATTEVQEDEFPCIETQHNGRLSQQDECQDLETKDISGQSLQKDKHQDLETKHSVTMTNGDSQHSHNENELSHDQNQPQDVETKKNDVDLSHKDNHVSDALNGNASSNNGDNLAIGERVIVSHKNRILFGLVRYVGHVPTKDDQQIGIELDKSMGTNNGTFNGVVYFKCKNKHGLFVSRDKVLRNT